MKKYPEGHFRPSEEIHVKCESHISLPPRTSPPPPKFLVLARAFCSLCTTCEVHNLQTARAKSKRFLGGKDAHMLAFAPHMYVYTDTHTQSYTHTDTCVCVCIMCVCVCVCVCGWVGVYVYVYMCIYTHAYICNTRALTHTHRKARTSSDKRTGGLTAEEAAATEGDCGCDIEPSPAAP